jgi:SAM-dependent methyltransferase
LAEQELHSAVYFGDQRDFWWNADFLALIAARLGLGGASTVLDVGSGQGHWGRTLAAVLSPRAAIVGVEPEVRWVEEARRRSDGDDRFTYVEGAAESLPFADASFDLVTCQTVLIHVADPHAALHEMLRVTKPGGRLLLAEPGNRSSILLGTSANVDASVDELLDVARFALTVEQGKRALGEGHNSLGDLLPGYLAEAGAVGIDVFTCDKASFMLPPYHGDEQQSLVKFHLEEAGDSGDGWSYEEALRYWTAGGGDPRDFGAAWARRKADSDRTNAAIEDGTFHTAGGSVHYLVSARKAC